MLNRRNFIEKLFRNLILVILALTSAYLVFKDATNEQQACDFDFICKNCKKNQNCTLPEAIEHKKEKKS